jgi:hypothetical protein
VRDSGDEGDEVSRIKKEEEEEAVTAGRGEGRDKSASSEEADLSKKNDEGCIWFLGSFISKQN